MSQQYNVPPTPRVISPSPTPSETGDGPGSYFAPVTRSAAKRASSSQSISEEQETDAAMEDRARARSRSPSRARRRRVSEGSGLKAESGSIVQKSQPLPAAGLTNGHLSPVSAATSYWREISRSPSPRLIPIHKSWRSFIHRHEIPRKMLHVSIGFFTLHFYSIGLQPASIHPWLLGAIVPIVSVDILRHRSASFNRFYVRILGALMRESEVNEKYNGVIFYLLGAWVSMRFFPKDIGVMAILLLSWCDTAASTVGRLYGKYTAKIRGGKSLAGSLAAALVGALTSVVFWGFVAPRDSGYEAQFMYSGSLCFPNILNRFIGLGSDGPFLVTGWMALGITSLWSGFVASASELVDVFGIDDNLTIPVLSGLGLWGFLSLFG